MKHTFLAISLLLFSFLVQSEASAIELTVEPGMLEESLGEARPVQLTLKGGVDVRDFDFLRSELAGTLTSLDLSDVTISAFSGELGRNGVLETSADALPEGALMLPSLKEIVLPNTLKEIGNGALATTSISKIEIPATVEKIGLSAFADCRQLENIVIPAEVSEIGRGTFADCSALVSADLSASKISALPQNAFANCTMLSNVSLPPTVTIIGDGVLKGCTALESLTLPTNISKIGEKAFYGSSIRAIDLENCGKITEIAPWAFANCASLKSVLLSESTTSIGTGAFFNTPEYNIDFTSNLQKIDDFAFANTKGVSSEQLVLPEGVEIGNYALAGWKGVQLLTLPPTMGQIGDEAMANWTSLKQIEAIETVEIPLLGRDVWAGVDQPSVLLRVDADLADQWKAAAQWNEFNIEAISTGIDDVEEGIDGKNIKSWFDGLTLHVEAPAEITALEIFDIDGRRFNMPTPQTGLTHVAVDTSAWNVRIMVVRVVLGDGTSAAIKLYR